MHAPTLAPAARCLVLLCSATLLYCSGDDASELSDGGAGRDVGSGGRDTGPSDRGALDTGPRVGPTDCRGPLMMDVLNLAPGMAVDPRAAAFGGSVWVVFSDANSNPSLVNLNCDGQTIQGPTVLDSTESRQVTSTAIHPLANNLFVSWLLADQRGSSGRHLKSALVNADGILTQGPQDIVVSDAFVTNPLVIPRGESFSVLARVLRGQSDNFTFIRNYDGDGQAVGNDTNIPRGVSWSGARGAKATSSSTITVHFVDPDNGGLGAVTQDLFLDGTQVTTGAFGPSDVNFRFIHDAATGLSLFDSAVPGQLSLNLETPQNRVVVDYSVATIIRSLAGQGDEAVALIQLQGTDELTLVFFERNASQWVLAEQRILDTAGPVALGTGDLVALEDGNYFSVWAVKDTGELKGRFVRR